MDILRIGFVVVILLVMVAHPVMDWLVKTKWVKFKETEGYIMYLDKDNPNNAKFINKDESLEKRNRGQ